MKRKADDSTIDQPITSKRAEKRKKKNLKKTSSVNQSDGINEEEGINEAIGKMDNRLIADHVAKQINRFEPKLSSLEVEERRIPGKICF